ncbi:MAG: hypothetical protein KKB31_02615 [Nanoarchaeota archaeon]|nr:hypothetical protein [Nanoarchaeota archaeon]
MKKLLLLCSALFLISLISAHSIEIEFPLGSDFEAGDEVAFKIILYDNDNTLLNAPVQVEIKDSQRKTIIKEVQSNQLTNMNLGEASSGQGTITATYEDAEAINFFEIGRKELAKFELEENTLKITNIGNTEYSKVVKITIGDTERTKEIDLGIGESTTFKLVAPEGVYNIKVTDGKTSLTRSNIALTGTGQAIGALDDSASRRSPVTGGVSPDENSDEALLSYIKNNSFVYVFIIAIFAAMILLGVERRYRKKVSK